MSDNICTITARVKKTRANKRQETKAENPISPPAGSDPIKATNPRTKKTVFSQCDGGFFRGTGVGVAVSGLAGSNGGGGERIILSGRAGAGVSRAISSSHPHRVHLIIRPSVAFSSFRVTPHFGHVKRAGGILFSPNL